MRYLASSFEWVGSFHLLTVGSNQEPNLVALTVANDPETCDGHPAMPPTDRILQPFCVADPSAFTATIGIVRNSGVVLTDGEHGEKDRWEMRPAETSPPPPIL
jgi:hypothetical protein